MKLGGLKDCRGDGMGVSGETLVLARALRKSIKVCLSLSEFGAGKGLALISWRYSFMSAM